MVEKAGIEGIVARIEETNCRSPERWSQFPGAMHELLSDVQNDLLRLQEERDGWRRKAERLEEDRQIADMDHNRIVREFADERDALLEQRDRYWQALERAGAGRFWRVYEQQSEQRDALLEALKGFDERLDKSLRLLPIGDPDDEATRVQFYEELERIGEEARAAIVNVEPGWLEQKRQEWFSRMAEEGQAIANVEGKDG